VTSSPSTQPLRRVFAARSVTAPLLLEKFLVSAVASLLLLRFYLEITGYPQVGGNGLHIAHLLWGGLLMLVAIVIMLAYLGETVRSAMAIVGGIGFGLFIDEIGKFVTSDNNYFFRPAIAMIYMVFVGLYLVFRLIDQSRPQSDEGYLVNALQLTSEAVVRGYDREDLRRAMLLLARVSPKNQLASALHEALAQIQATPERRAGWWLAFTRGVRRRYRRLVRASWFPRLVFSIFLVYAIATLITLGVTLLSVVNEPLRQAGISLKGDIVFTLVGDVLVVAGVVLWRRSRLRALNCFKLAILASILFTMPFLFYTDQLAALGWLIVDLILLVALNYMIVDERRRGLAEADSTEQISPAGTPAEQTPGVVA
jgi:hypothetical protein